MYIYRYSGGCVVCVCVGLFAYLMYICLSCEYAIMCARPATMRLYTIQLLLVGLYKVSGYILEVADLI